MTDWRLITCAAASLGTVTSPTLIGANTQTMARAVVAHTGEVARIVRLRQHRVAVAVQRQAGPGSPTRAVAVQHVAYVAVEARQKNGGRRRERRHSLPVGRRKATNVDVAVVV